MEISKKTNNIEEQRKQPAIQLCYTIVPLVANESQVWKSTKTKGSTSQSRDFTKEMEMRGE